MEFKDLLYILTIAKYGKVSTAASELFIAQSSLSQFLKNYENSLGFPLFIRTNRGLFLTEEGKLFVESGKQILAMRRDFFNKISDLQNLKIGSVNFSISPFRAPYLLPRVIPVFTKAYPDIRLTIHEGSMKEQEEMLAQCEIDMGFLTLPMDNEQLPYRPATNEEILLAVPAGHPLCAKAHEPGPTGRAWLAVEALSGQNFLMYSINHRLRSFAETLFRDHQLNPRIIQSHNSFETLIRLAEAGMGVTFLPETYLEPREGLRHFSLGRQGMSRQLVLGYVPSGYVSKAAAAFSDIVVEELRRQKEAARLIP